MGATTFLVTLSANTFLQKLIFSLTFFYKAYIIQK